MGAAATLLTIGSGLLGAYGSYAQGQANAAAAEAQAKVADQNARTAEAQADESMRQGARESQRFRQQARQQAASQASALAASGGTMSGSALTVMGDTQMGIEQDAMTLRYNTLKDRYGHQVQATDYRNQAHSARASAKNAKRAGTIGAFTSLLGMGGSLYSMSSPTTATYSSGSGITVAASAPAKRYTSKRYEAGWYK